MVAEMPAWRRPCTPPSTCADEETAAIAAYFAIWAHKRACGWSETNWMKSHLGMGVGPLLEAGLRLAHHRIVTTAEGRLGPLQMLSIWTNVSRVDYIQADLIANDTARHLVELHASSGGRTRVATLVKAAGGLVAHASALGTRLLHMSELIVCDESGPLDQLAPLRRPALRAMGDRAGDGSGNAATGGEAAGSSGGGEQQSVQWIIEARGDFERLRAARSACSARGSCHVHWSKNHTFDPVWPRVFAQSAAATVGDRQLPFRFGYGEADASGLMVLAWRRHANGARV